MNEARYEKISKRPWAEEEPWLRIQWYFRIKDIQNQKQQWAWGIRQILATSIFHFILYPFLGSSQLYMISITVYGYDSKAYSSYLYFAFELQNHVYNFLEDIPS